MKKYLLLFLFISSFSFAQSADSLVWLHDIDSTILTEVRYATPNNFTGQILYKSDKVYLRKVVAESLSNAHKSLMRNYALRIKVFDGYRPLSIQKKMWEVMPDDRYVADPAKGSRHNRGAAVDLTLVDVTGREIDMGTPYDDFTEKSHIDYKKLSKNALTYRAILRSTMEKFGFEAMSSEWWHFDFKGWSKFPIMDVEIE
ncbi:MAG: M15 family metallopeptidase [Bacteroidetes bacterium]|nr:M15 family metallopeptidase [Bacteroidota bacterium]MBU2585568.1 M15 family metallopeptidase [Bacteroidota bacterium]